MAPPQPSEGNPPKLAMKGFSLSVLSKNGPNTNRNGTPNTNTSGRANATGNSGPRSSLGKRPRSAFAAGGRSDDSDSEHEGPFQSGGRDRQRKDGRRGGFEEVSGLEHGKVVLRDEDEHRAKRKDEKLIIPKTKNKDWRAELRARNGAPKGKNLLPPEVQAQRAAEAASTTTGGAKAEGVDVVNSQDGEIKWGLTIRKTKTEDENGEVTETVTEEVEIPEDAPEESKPQTADEEAISALLGERKEKKGPDLVIPATASNAGRMTEGDAFKLAVQEAPDASTLEDYERVPVEEFGAALLRGMGWKGEKKEGAKEVKRRQNLLGLGAKELKGAEELGAWVQKSDIKRLNTGGGKNGGYGGERRPKASEYAREKDRKREEREDRGGGGYRRERERERDRDRERERGYRDGDRRR